MCLFSHPWIRKKKIHAIPSIFLWENLLEWLIYIHCLHFLISYSLFHLSISQEKLPLRSSWIFFSMAPVSWFPLFPLDRSFSLLQKASYFFTSPKILLFFPHESPTMPISPWLYLAGVCYLQPRNISNRLLSTMYPKHPNLLRPKKANSYYQNLNHKWQ